MLITNFRASGFEGPEIQLRVRDFFKTQTTRIARFRALMPSAGFPYAIIQVRYASFVNVNFYIVLEPVGFKAPKFSSEYKTFSLERAEKSPFTLFCQAQGYPVPSFRYS
jgi:hypothetical protein